MATQIQTLLIDDLDGGEAKETITFGIDGSGYEIDLNDKNAKKLRAALTPFAENARKAVAVTSARGRRSGTTRARTNREQSAEIRAWALAHGITVSARGRIASTVVEQYNAAH